MLSQKEYEKIVLLPLYPHYSTTTTGSSFRAWQRSYTGDPSHLIYIDHYCTNETYIFAINQRIDEAVLRFPADIRDNIQIVFSAHGIPEKLVKKGDPYSGQIKKTVEGVMAALREAQEESGMQRFELLAPRGELMPLDLDVHAIPARKDEPEHLRWDVRFLLRCAPGQELVLFEESKALRWVPRDELRQFVQEDSVLRLEQTAAQWAGLRGADALAACAL